MAINYKDLGLVNTREMYKKAINGGYGVPAFNFNNMEQVQAIIQACAEVESPVILMASTSAIKYADMTFITLLGEGAVKYSRKILGGNRVLPIALHLDHGDTFDTCKYCIENGFSSVMIDGSKLPYEENIRVTKEVVDYAHQFDITVEGELGVLAGIEDEVSSETHTYTRPEDVIDFTGKTGVDSLAISIGTSHGAYKFKPGQNPKIRLDILREIEKKIPGFPIVLHGASSVPQDLVKMVNDNGGKLKEAIGIGEDQLREASKSAICKINIDTDGRIAMLAAIRKYFAEKPEDFDMRKYLGAAKEITRELYKDKCINVFGSDHKAFL